jgi:hypothetical protein
LYCTSEVCIGSGASNWCRSQHFRFTAKRKGGPRQPLRYRRFATAAEAIRFAVQELPAVRALGAWMQVGDQRFDGDDIQRLYESDDFTLQRRLAR